MQQEGEPEIDPRLFRHVMSRFPTGVTVITASDAGEVRGMTANAFMSGSLEPPLCVVSVAKRANMHALLLEAKCFGVNVLADHQIELSDHFAGTPNPKLAIAFEMLAGTPLLRDACARIAAETAARHDCGDHTIFIGHILHMDANARPPLVYHGGRYGALIHRRGDHEVTMPEFW
jgi:flavin reductase (DIM6/NTAB) family NADH-FMN oxidoreductase RutF